VSNHAAAFRQVLERDPAMLRQIRRGVEKEGLRVTDSDATLSQSRHPVALGSALTHASITTDYSEALLEFITPVSESIEATEKALADLHRFTAQNLEGELLWNASMPCIVNGDAGIPIAEFGHSNVGQMKRVYRNGLSVRYGRKMQAIAGIHYNFSLPAHFWDVALEYVQSEHDATAFQTEGYLGLIRNFFSRVWLLLYLLGASPTVCASFLQGNRSHPLLPMGDDHHSYFLPYATSLRMGDLGYTSNAQGGMDVCYNDLNQYITTLRKAILTPHAPYRAFQKMDNGERAQLNNSLLQIENEFYSPIRPKRVTRSGEPPVVALARSGIEYVEVRCVDINPFTPHGIDADTMRLIDLFLIACLIDDSPLCDEEGQRRNRENLQRVVSHGRDPALTLLSHSGEEVTLAELATPILDRMTEIASWFDGDSKDRIYEDVVRDTRQRVSDPSKTLSARMLKEMDASGLSFWQLANRYSRQWHAEHLATPIEPSALAQLADEAASSVVRQQQLESQESLSFEDYLAQFYAQYRSQA
jgi:glutamate--cysteine ligase